VKLENRQARIDVILMSVAIFLLTLSFFSVKIFALSIVFLLLSYGRLYQVFGGISFDFRSSIVAVAALLFVSLFSIFHEFYFNYFVKVVAISLMMILFSGYFLKFCNRTQFQFFLKFVIVLHSSFFLIQFAVYLASGYFIEFDSYIRDGESEVLYMSRALDGLSIQIRGTGLFSEPSFYSMSVLPFTVTLMLLDKRISGFALIGLGTSLLSLSIAAIAIVALSCLVYAIAVGLTKREKIIVMVVALVAGPFFYTIYDLRVNQSIDYNALESRGLIFDEISLRNWSEALLGEGFLWDELYPQGILNLNGANIRDSSFYVYLLYCSGYLGLAIFLFAMIKMFGVFSPYLYLLLCMLLFKHHFINAMFWIVVFVLYIASIYDIRALNSEDGNDNSFS